MKEKAIMKINMMGKVGAILALISKIFVSVLLGLCVLGFGAILFLPGDLCKLKVNGTADVLINLSSFGVDFNDTETQQIKENVEKNANISYAGNEFSVDRVDVGDSSIDIGASASLTELDLKDCLWVLSGVILNLVLLLISIIYASRLAKAFRNCQSPFEKTVITRMKQFAYSLIPWAVISSIVNMLQSRIVISNGGFHLNIDFGIVIMVLLILALAYVFQYGSMLQQESDETL